MIFLQRRDSRAVVGNKPIYYYSLRDTSYPGETVTSCIRVVLFLFLKALCKAMVAFI